MAIHQRELLREIEEDQMNPLAAWIETRLAKAAVNKLLVRNTPTRIREVLISLSEATGFPLAKYLWNAAHPDIPLYCFFRIRREPVFRILSIDETGDSVGLHVEIYRLRNRQRIVLTRDKHLRLAAPSFAKAADQG